MIDYRNPTIVKASIRILIALLLIFGVQLPEGTEESAIGVYLALDTILTYSAGKKQSALEKKVDGRV